MRLSLKQYSSLLEKLVLDLKSREEVEKIMESFLSFVALGNDTRFLKKIVQNLEEKLIKNGELLKMSFEISEHSKKTERVVAAIKDSFSKKKKSLLLKTSLNPELISGVRIIYNDSCLIESSFNHLLNKMFES